MQNVLLPHVDPPECTADRWRRIDALVSEACVLRAEGREAEAIAIVQHTLPPLIGEWSRGSGMAGEKCQQVLRELFARVQHQVATATICKRLVLQSIDPTAPRSDDGTGRVQIRRRVPVGDIPGMLDALDEGERAAAFRRQHFPSRSLRPQPALAPG